MQDGAASPSAGPREEADHLARLERGSLASGAASRIGQPPPPNAAAAGDGVAGGIRTLSSHHPDNPFAYHLGTSLATRQWHHRGGHEALRPGERGKSGDPGIFDAARTFESYRPPELFAGLQRKGNRTDFPAVYPPGANVPQAWASGSISSIRCRRSSACAPTRHTHGSTLHPRCRPGWRTSHSRGCRSAPAALTYASAPGRPLAMGGTGSARGRRFQSAEHHRADDPTVAVH